MQTVILQLLQWALPAVRGRRIGRRAVGNGIDTKGFFVGFPRPAVDRGSRTSGTGGKGAIDSERRHGQAEGSVRGVGANCQEAQTSMETRSDTTTVCPPLEDDRSEVCIGKQCLCRQLL
jgi:hypothetical protein